MIYAAAAVLATGVVLVFVRWHDLLLGWQSRRRPQTEATIAEHIPFHEYVRELSPHTHTPSGGTNLGWECRYVYEIKGEIFESTRFDSDGSRWNAKGYDRLPEIGSMIVVYYHPQDPSIVLVKPGMSGTERQWFQVQKAAANDLDAYLDREGLKREMKKWKFPLHFIDFETATPAIPLNRGRRPYEIIAFQFSHHIVDEDGHVRHVDE